MLELFKRFNVILAADGYKAAHWLQIPAAVNRLVGAVVPRKILPYSDEIVAAGQTFISGWFDRVRLEQWMIDEAEIEITQQGYHFNREGWEYILRVYGGRIPLTMFGVEEGRVVTAQMPIFLVTVEDDHLAWLTPYFEPLIQSVIWSMTYTATISRYMYATVAHYMLLTGSDMSMLEYKVHYFGDRAASSPDETPVLKAIAHAMLFSGSDSLRANGYIKVMYNTAKVYTTSVEATEHTTICLNSDAETRDDRGGMDMVMDRLHELVKQAKAGIGIPVISTVPDTYDDERFVRIYVAGYKVEIENSGGRLVVRPDSGIPEKKLPEVLGWLEEIFGVALNKKDYRNLPPCIGALYGDGMNVYTFEAPIKAATDAGYSVDNYLLGMGDGIANEGSRDKLSFSMKVIAQFRDGRWSRVLKEPKSDMGKKSLSGLIRNRELDDGTLETFDALKEGCQFDMFTPGPGHRRWLDKGCRDWRQSFDNVRERARQGVVVTEEEAVA